MKGMWAKPKALTLHLVFFLALAPIALFGGRMLRAPTPGERALVAKSAVVAAYGKLPLSFEANRGGRLTNRLNFCLGVLVMDCF